MGSLGYFTKSDRGVIQRAAFLAEGLTQRYFGLTDDLWRRNPYGIFTLKEVNYSLCNPDAFANVVRFRSRRDVSGSRPHKDRYGIVLHDPNILLALLRSGCPDLWTLGLFVLTHELTHIVRFSEHDVDFFASSEDREAEELAVHEMTSEILSGVTNTNYVLDLYKCGDYSDTGYLDISSSQGGC
jgi:hypothetical protein